MGVCGRAGVKQVRQIRVELEEGKMERSRASSDIEHTDASDREGGGKTPSLLSGSTAMGPRVQTGSMLRFGAGSSAKSSVKSGGKLAVTPSRVRTLLSLRQNPMHQTLLPGSIERRRALTAGRSVCFLPCTQSHLHEERRQHPDGRHHNPTPHTPADRKESSACVSSHADGTLIHGGAARAAQVTLCGTLLDPMATVVHCMFREGAADQTPRLTHARPSVHTPRKTVRRDWRGVREPVYTYAGGTPGSTVGPTPLPTPGP